MKVKFIVLLLISYPIVTNAQTRFRPIIDSLAACSYYDNLHEYTENPATSKQTLQIFYIVEKMPIPKIPFSEIENTLRKSVRLNKDEMTLNGDVYLQCVVNCKGKAGDFQINHCPAEFANIGRQLINIFLEKAQDWEPGIQRKKSVDVLILIKIKLRKGNFEVVTHS